MIVEEALNKCKKALEEYLNSNSSIRELSVKYKIDRGFFSGYALGKGIDIYSRKSKCNDRIFDVIDTEDKAYWLGFLYADGCVYKFRKEEALKFLKDIYTDSHIYLDRKYDRFIAVLSSN